MEAPTESHSQEGPDAPTTSTQAFRAGLAKRLGLSRRADFNVIGLQPRDLLVYWMEIDISAEREDCHCNGVGMHARRGDSFRRAGVTWCNVEVNGATTDSPDFISHCTTAACCAVWSGDTPWMVGDGESRRGCRSRVRPTSSEGGTATAPRCVEGCTEGSW